jgi:hypothetical protein
MPRPLSTPGKDPAPIIQEAGWAPGPVWTGAENLALTRIRSLDRPACSQLLYQLSHWAYYMVCICSYFLWYNPTDIKRMVFGITKEWSYRKHCENAEWV